MPAFAFIFGLGLLARLLLVFFVPGYQSTQGMDSYELWALNLLEGNGFVFEGHGASAYRTPFYPIFIAAIYALFGRMPQAVWALQCVLGACTAFMLYRLATRYVSERLAWLAGGVAAVYPPLIYYNGLLLAETLFAFLFTAALLLLAPRWSRQSASRLAAAGVLLGLSALTKPVSFFMPMALVGFTGLSSLAQRARIPWQAFAILLIAFGLTMTPWTARNALVMGKPIPTSTQGGLSLWLGLHPDPRGFGYGGIDDHFARVYQGEENTAGEVKTHEFFVRESMREIMAKPWRFAKLAVVKLGWFFYPFDGERYGMGSPYNILTAIVMTFALLGLLLSPRREMVLPACAVAYFAFFAAVAFGTPRYRVALEPVLILLGVSGLHQIGKMPLARAKAFSALACALVLLHAGLALWGEGFKDSVKTLADTTLGYSRYFQR